MIPGEIMVKIPGYNNFMPFKQWARSNLPPQSTLGKVILMENDFVRDECMIGMVMVYLKLADLE